MIEGSIDIAVVRASENVAAGCHGHCLDPRHGECRQRPGLAQIGRAMDSRSDIGHEKMAVGCNHSTLQRAGTRTARFSQNALAGLAMAMQKARRAAEARYISTTYHPQRSIVTSISTVVDSSAGGNTRQSTQQTMPRNHPGHNSRYHLRQCARSCLDRDDTAVRWAGGSGDSA